MPEAFQYLTSQPRQRSTRGLSVASTCRGNSIGFENGARFDDLEQGVTCPRRTNEDTRRYARSAARILSGTDPRRDAQNSSVHVPVTHLSQHKTMNSVRLPFKSILSPLRQNLGLIIVRSRDFSDAPSRPAVSTLNNFFAINKSALVLASSTLAGLPRKSWR